MRDFRNYLHLQELNSLDVKLIFKKIKTQIKVFKNKTRVLAGRLEMERPPACFGSKLLVPKLGLLDHANAIENAQEI